MQFISKTFLWILILKNELGLLGELVDDNAGVVAVQPGDVQALLAFFQLIFQPEKQ